MILFSFVSTAPPTTREQRVSYLLANVRRDLGELTRLAAESEDVTTALTMHEVLADVEHAAECATVTALATADLRCKERA